MSENKNQDRKNFVKSWEGSSKSKTKPNKKLTYSLVSELTGLSIETIRRQVKKLINDGWVTYTKKEGIIYMPHIDKAKEMTEHLNPKEIDIGLTIYNKENNDLTYTIVDKKEMNGILHYLIESRARASSGSIYLSEYAIKERFGILRDSEQNIETKPSVSNLYSKITDSVNKES